MLHGSWDMEHNRQFFVWSTTDNFLSFRAIFRPFIPLNTWKIKILKKWKKKKMPWDIISLHLCTTNDNHMVYGSWGMEHNRQIVLSFWVIFCSFTSLTRKIRILKKWKQFLEIYRYTSSFYNCIPQMKIIWYIKWKKKKKKKNKKKLPGGITITWCMVLKIWSATGRISCHFGSFFAFLPH